VAALGDHIHQANRFAFFLDLILRSISQAMRLEGWPLARLRLRSSFETPGFAGAPQDEVKAKSVICITAPRK
jgi:hypothetical protein